MLEALSLERNPVYATADIVIDSAETPHQVTVQAIIEAMRARLNADVGAQ